MIYRKALAVSLILLCGSAAIANPPVPELDGVWRYGYAQCLSGQLVNEFRMAPDDYATYVFDVAAGKVRAKFSYSANTCTVILEGRLTIEATRLKASKFKIVSSTCDFKLAEDDIVDSFEIRKLPSGENALVVTRPPNTLCDENGIGEIFLLPVPYG